MKIEKSDRSNSVVFKTTDSAKDMAKSFMWWNAKSQKDLGQQVLSTVAFLKENQGSRFRQLSIYSRLYGNMSLFGFAGVSNRLDRTDSALPLDRPTFNLVQSASDTLVARIAQSRPSPVFLTDGSDYQQRNLAKKLNNFIQGEFYATKAYEVATIALRDALVTGSGCVKVLELNQKVALERVLQTELFVDPNEALYGKPRQLHQVKLIDRKVLAALFPEAKAKVESAANAYPDNSGESAKTVSDIVMVVESWHLRSGPDSKDGRHVITCDSGVLIDEEWEKDYFPFAFIHYSPRMLGFWAQGLAEQLMGTQIEINQLLYTISRAIRLVGVPRVFVEDGSKVVKAQFNNEIGAIVTYRGTKPQYEVAPCVPNELYVQLQRLIDYGYQQCGVSSLQAASQKPAGLNSGAALRSYDDIATDRFNTLSRRYDDFFIELAYLMIDLAKDIAERDGSYETVYPGKNATQTVDLPKADMLDNKFVIQCFNQSSLPRDPAGRMQKVTEMITSGMISIKEGRRLLDYPDLEQVERLANASEERIFKILDDMVNDGTFTPPDPFMDLQLASELTTQYINLYGATNLEEEKMQMMRDFFTQIQALLQGAMAAAAPPPGAAPMPAGGVPEAPVAAPPTQTGVNSVA